MSSEILDLIKSQVEGNDVVLYMKGEANEPRCGFSATVVQILSHLGVSFLGVNILNDRELHEGIKAYTDWPTIPQLYIKGEFIGGCDITREMFEAGELQDLLSEEGII